jgi:TIR domain
LQYNRLSSLLRAGFRKLMKIFLSYPSAHKETSASINYELQAAGHEVFFDREDLPAGQSYDEKIRSAIDESDLFIFMITPESVAKGRYTLTELKIASRKWPNPTGRVLPVMIEATPFEAMPAYLKAVTVLTPEGNVAAEVLMEVADLATAHGSESKKADLPDAALESYSYRPIEIRFGRGVAGAYPVAVTGSPAGSLPATLLIPGGWTEK